LYVLSSKATDLGVRGSCTNIYFSVLCFKNAKGETILCSIILKSMKVISLLPSYVKLTINWTINITSVGTRLEVIDANL
jgi:hypothetical protein